MLGAIPIATLNLQRGVAPGIVIPDAWHHQMVFGVGPQGVYLCNPLECVREEVLWPQLSSPSELMIRRHDVLVRWDMTTDLRCLAEKPWSNTNVLGEYLCCQSVSNLTIFLYFLNQTLASVH